MIRKIKIKTSVIFCSLIFAGLACSAQAIEYGQMGGRPTNPDPNVPESKSWFIYKLEPGTSKEDSVTVVNLFNEDWDALIYAADSVKSSSGGFALKQISEEKKGVGSWVKFYPDPKPDYAAKIFEGDRKIFEACAISAEDLTEKYKLSSDQINEFAEWCKGKSDVTFHMKSGEKKDLTFVISIPQGTEIGEHTGGILIQKQNKEEADQANGSKVLLTTRVGVRIYETVPGEMIKKLDFFGFSIDKNYDEFYLPWDKEKKTKFSEYIISSSIKNNGNVSIGFKEKIVIKNLITKKVENIEGREFQVLRDDDFMSILSWKAPRMAFLSFQKEYSYEDANGQNQTLFSETIKKWFIPWREIVIFAVLFILAFSFYKGWKYYQKKKYGGIGWVAYEVQSGDDINNLAIKSGVDWKVLAKTNKLKVPYILEIGQVILVPASGDLPEEPAADNFKIRNEVEENADDKYIKEMEAIAEEMEQKVAKKRGRPKMKNIAMEKEYVVSEISQTDEKIEQQMEAKTEAKKPEENKDIYKKITIILLLAILLVALIGISIFCATLFMRAKNESTANKMSVATLAVNNAAQEESDKKTENATSTPAQQENNTKAEESKAEDIEKKESKKPAEISIKILNGGAVAGSAAKIKDILTNKGYSKTEAQNAQENNHEGLVVYHAGTLEAEAGAVRELLKANYPKAEIKPASSVEEKMADIVIILGK